MPTPRPATLLAPLLLAACASNVSGTSADAGADAGRADAPDATADAGSASTIRFGETFCFSTAPSLERIAPGDLDRDGRVDVVLEYRARVGSTVGDGYGYARNASAGGAVRFDPAVEHLSTAGAPRAAAAVSQVVDLDGDGWPELVRDARWWPGAGGPLTPATFDREGQNLVVSAGFITPDPATLAVLDLDGDGRRDLASVQNPTGCAILAYPRRGAAGEPLAFDLQRILRVYVRGLTRCTSLAFGDLDGDGRPDAVVTSDNADRGSGEQGFAALRNLTAPGRLEEGSFGAQVRVNTGPAGARRSTANARLADFDGDGALDLFYTTAQPNSPGSRGALRRNARAATFGEATFGPEVTLPDDLGDGARVAVADLDGDGDPDLAGLTDGRVVTLQNLTPRGGDLAAGAFASRAFTLAAPARAPALADVDGDGLADVVFVSDAAFCVTRNTTPR